MRTHVAALERQLNNTLHELSILELRMDRVVDREEDSLSPPHSPAVLTSAEILQSELDRRIECLPEGDRTPNAVYTFKRSKGATRRPSKGGLALATPLHSTT
jgi:hypothetical protein